MTKHAKRPHDEIHARMMRKFREMSPQEVFELSQRAGIYDAAGRLTKPYRAQCIEPAFVWVLLRNEPSSKEQIVSHQLLRRLVQDKFGSQPNKHLSRLPQA